VVPGSSRNSIAGIWAESLKVNIAAPPEKGKANQQLLKLLAQLLELPKSNLSIKVGSHQPRKEIHVAGITEKQLRQKLAAFLKT
jgi:uncharacterized protein (TIGR00251 family)